MIAIILAIVVVGAGGFYAGMKYDQSRRQSSFAAGGQFGGAAGGLRGAGGTGGTGGRNRPVSGDIISSDSSSITVKLPDGSSKIVLITGSTQINKADQATKADLTVGAKVAVFGSANSDGSVTAQNIQLNPMMRGVSGPSATSPTQGATNTPGY